MGMIIQNEKMFGGTSDYENLNNKPKINSVELSGNKTSSELGIPTNAEELPIQSGSATNTKDYIDERTSVTSSIISESNPYISVVKVGKICVVRVNTQNYTVTQGTIGTLPVGFRPANTFVSRSYRGENNYLGISGSLIESDNAPKYTAMSFTFYQEE